jgi:hypothetical protein
MEDQLAFFLCNSKGFSQNRYLYLALIPGIIAAVAFETCIS